MYLPGIVQFDWRRFWVHTCVFVCDVWYEMCVLIPSSVIWTCGSSSPADFIISTRLLCALLLCQLCVQCGPVDSSVLSSVWTMVHLVQSMLWKWYFKLMSPLYSTAMWHLISVIFIDLQRFSVEKTQHFKFNGVNGYIPVLSIPWQKVREKWPKCQCPDEIMFWWEDNQGRKMLQNHFTLE